MNIAKTTYCRLCAVQKPYSKLSDLDTNVEKWGEIVAKLNRINADTGFNTNNLPKTVCFVCINSLERAYEFVITVENAQSTLHDIQLVQVKKENFDFESDNSVYEPSVKHEGNVIGIKIEAGTSDLSNLMVPSSGKFKSIEEGKKRQVRSLDTIPLAQLKLTWKDYSWLCSFCETQFPTIDELREHSMQYHNCCNPYRCTDCNIKKFRLDSFLIHVQRHKKYLRLSCYKCLKKFSSTTITIKHKKAHNKSKFICLGCNTNFANIDDLTEHTTQYYINRRARPIPIQCDSLTCPICGKSYKAKSGLYTHLLTHTDRKRDHICEICGKSFLHKQNLIGHMVLHNDERPFKCKICKYAFKTQTHLRNHVGVHDGAKPFSCDQCGKCFRLKKQLACHSVIHTDLLPHVCTYCNKEFRFKSILTQHLRQHTGVKPYKCGVCDRDFTNWPNYNKHMKRKHGMDMAKKKHTPEGLYPIDPKTGEVVYPELENVEEWKREVMQQRRPGRPKATEHMVEIEIETKKDLNVLSMGLG